MVLVGNHKVSVDIGLDAQRLFREVAILDTLSGFNCRRMDEVSKEEHSHVRQGPLPEHRDANRNHLHLISSIPLRIKIRYYRVEVTFLLCWSLAAYMMVGVDFCGRFIKVIGPRAEKIERSPRNQLPIIPNPSPPRDVHGTKALKSPAQKDTARDRTPTVVQSTLHLVISHHHQA